MQKRTTARGNSLLQERTRIWVFKNVQGNLLQKIPKSTKRTTRSGRTSTAHLVLTFHTSRKSTRACDNNSNAIQKTKWKTSMWVRWYGESLWLSLSKPQFITETIVWTNYIQPQSATKNSRTIVWCDEKVGQGSERNWRFIHDRLARTFLENDETVDWPCSSVINSESLRILWFSTVHGQNHCKIP